MENLMAMIDLTDIINAVLALLAAIVTAKVIPWIKAKTTTEQQNALMSITSVLVFAAEQLYGTGKGAEKLDYVITELEKRGYTADRAAIEAVIKDYAEQNKLDKSQFLDVLNELQDSAEPFDTFDAWMAFAEKELIEFKEKMKSKKKEDSVVLLTMHRSKGLEWEDVIIIDANEEITPYYKYSGSFGS